MLKVGINVLGAVTADKLPKTYLYKARGHHVQHASLRLFVFLKSRGVTRDHAEQICSDFGAALRSALTVEDLFKSDELACKVGITPDCRFIFPEESQSALKNCMKGIIDKHPILANWFGERTTSESAPMICPSNVVRGIDYKWS